MTKPDDLINGINPLTKREEFAKSAMIGILGSYDYTLADLNGDNIMVDKIAVASVKQADALIKALNDKP